ncbi:MAG: DNA-3-methyladenine glycosylase family protein [Acidimicrobiales bacterium]
MGTRHLELEAPPSFRLDLTVWALRRRPHNTVDRWNGATYRRILVADAGPIQIAVRQNPDADRPRLTVELRQREHEPSDTAVDEIRHSLERTLGLSLDLSGFYDLARKDERLNQLAQRFCGMRPPRFPSMFEALVNAVACQQLSLTVGIHLLDRLSAAYGPTTGGRAVASGFPTPERLAEVEPSQLRRLGFSLAKARTVVMLAHQVASRALDLDALEHRDDNHVFDTLVALPGIGRWSAEYSMLRGLGRLHVLPGDDVGARNNLRRRFDLSDDAGYDSLTELSRRWSPYGGLVYLHLLLDSLESAKKLVGRREPSENPLPHVAVRDRGEVA